MTEIKRRPIGRLVIISVLLVALPTLGCRRTPEEKQAKFLETGKKRLLEQDYSRAILDFRNAALAKPSNPEPYYQLAMTYMAMRNWGNAVAFFKKTIELDPKHTAAQLKLAEMMALADDPSTIREANQRLRSLASGSPDNADVLTALALTEWKLAEPQDAEQYLKRVVEKFPQHLNAAVALAGIKMSQGDFAAAEDALKKSTQQSPPSADAFMALGSFYASRGKTAEAETQFRRALEINPKNGQVLVALAAVQVRAGNPAQAEETYRRVSALPDKEYKPLHAIFLLQSGKTDAAIEEFRRLSNNDPNDRDARNRLVAALVTAKRVPEAEKTLNEVLKKNPKDVDARLQRSRLFLDAGKKAEAQSDVTEVLRFRPDSAEGHYLMAKLHEAQGKTLSQRQELGEAVRLRKDFLIARLELADLLTRTNAAKSALTVLDESPDNQRESLPVIIRRNWALLASRDEARLRRGIDQGLTMAKVPDLFLQDALLKLAQGNHVAALISCEEVLRLDPADVRALHILAQIYTTQKQPAMALQKVQEHAAKAPQAAAVQHYLGQLLSSTGNREAARKAFTATKKADSGFTPADVALAQLDVYDGRITEARARLAGVLSVDGANIPARLLLSQIAMGAQHFPEAIDQCLKVIESDPNNAVALNNLAYSLTEINKPDEALKHAERAKELAPENRDIDDTLGWVLYRKGVYARAVKYLEEAAKDKSALSNYHLAMAYLKAGDEKRGRQTLEIAQRINPDLPEAKMANQILYETVKTASGKKKP